MEEHRIGIPGILLGSEKGLRLPIGHIADGLIVLEKPLGIGSRPDPWYPETPDLERCINIQAEQGKPELIHHRISSLNALCPVEPEVSGLVLCITDRDTGIQWKNFWGSLFFSSHHLIICEPDPSFEPRKCELPIARHFNLRKMVVSHTTGKKTQTCFTPLIQSSKAGIWLASTCYSRLHQIRIHAMESGLRLFGDPIYSPEPPPEPAFTRTGKTSKTAHTEEPLPPALKWQHLYAYTAEPSTGLDLSPFRAPLSRALSRMIRNRLDIDPEALITSAEQAIQQPPTS